MFKALRLLIARHRMNKAYRQWEQYGYSIAASNRYGKAAYRYNKIKYGGK